jgi:hypothetical protein
LRKRNHNPPFIPLIAFDKKTNYIDRRRAKILLNCLISTTNL